MSYIQTNALVLLPASAAVNISVNDTGKIMITPQTAGVGFVYTLPAPEPGLHYRFINGASLALNGTVAITTTGAVAIIYGSIVNGPTNGVQLVAVNGNAIIGFNNAVSLRGDYIDLTSDGTNYYVDARSRVANGIAVA